MKPVLAPMFVCIVFGLGACSKPTATENGAAPAPAQKRNLAESLGFASDADSFSREAPVAAPAATAARPGGAGVGRVTRTLTSRDGRTVEAVLLGRTATTVRIRRVADGAEFTIALETLAAGDQAFIRQSAIAVLP